MRLARLQRPEVWNWSAFDQLTSIRDEINRLFDSPAQNGGSDVFNTWSPALDLYEDKDNLVLRAEIPGLKKEDIDISVHENVVSITGERRSEKKVEGDQSAREERSYGRFTRSLKLPKQVDANRVKAAYKDGILSITLAKAEEAKPRQIEIKS